MRIPSLSVEKGLPSKRRKLAPALSSPAKPSHPSRSPATKCLNPTGVSYTSRPRAWATRSRRALVTAVFPTLAPGQDRVV